MKSAADDFAMFLLGWLDYGEPERAIHQRLEIGFIMSGARFDAKSDICILDVDDCLLIQENRASMTGQCDAPSTILIFSVRRLLTTQSLRSLPRRLRQFMKITSVAGNQD